MNAADVVGYVSEDGEIYCPACTPSNEFNPIFHDSETDSPNHCATCEEMIEEQFTSVARDMMIDRMEDYLTARSGRKEILHQWARGLDDGSLEPVQEKVRDLCYWATSEPREDPATLVNILGSKP